MSLGEVKSTENLAAGTWYMTNAWKARKLLMTQFQQYAAAGLQT